MHGVEHLWQLDPNRRQLVYVEETAVIDFFRGDAPKRKAIRLRVEQLIQDVEAARVARFSIDLRQRLFHRLLHLRRFGTKPLQASFDDFFFANSLRNLFRIGFGPFRQVFERSENAL